MAIYKYVYLRGCQLRGIHKARIKLPAYLSVAVIYPILQKHVLIVSALDQKLQWFCLLSCKSTDSVAASIGVQTNESPAYSHADSGDVNDPCSVFHVTLLKQGSS